jgi:hypothetical protein
MFRAGKMAACAAVCVAAAFGLAAPPARADESGKSGLARDLLRNVPIFYVANADGSPMVEDGSTGPTFYLTRAQASIAVGLARADRAGAGHEADELHVELTDLADAGSRPAPHTFVRPVNRLEASAAIPGVPLFLVRDKEGIPFTVRDGVGRRRVFFYLSEADAQAFVVRVLTETDRRADDVVLSMVSLGPVLDSILNSPDPLVQNWTIWSSAETRMDADSLKTEAQAQLAPRQRSE